MSDLWRQLDRELDAWQAAGLKATFWLRDDDAQTDTPALRRLLETGRDAGAPISLAVIPRDADAALADAVSAFDDVHVLQHGWCHANHAGAGEKKFELGDHRPLAVVGDELDRGDRRLRALFGNRYYKILAPPWNRIGTETASALQGWGYRGLSAFGPRGSTVAAPGVTCINTHIDIIDWKGTRGYRGDGAVIAQALSRLCARREGREDREEPTGLITHHLVHDEGCWQFIAAFINRTRRHPAAHWLTLPETFGLR